MSYKAIETRAGSEATVQFGTTPESLHLEFKTLYRWTDEASATKQAEAIELCRDLAQFANAEGGVLLVGVSEEAKPDGRKVASGIVSVQDPDGFVRWVEQAVRNNLVPSTFSKTVRTVDTSAGLVVAINVPPHIHLVGLWPQADRRGIEYVKRNNHGKGWLNPDEVEEHLMDGSRAVRLAAKRVFEGTSATRFVDIVPPIAMWVATMSEQLAYTAQLSRDHEVQPILKSVDEHHVVLSMSPSATVLHVPYPLIKSIWVGADGRPALSLAARIIREAGGERMSFYLDAL